MSLFATLEKLKEERAIKRAIDNAKTRIMDAGHAVPEPVKTGASALGKAVITGLEHLDRPRNAAALGMTQIGINLKPGYDSRKRSIAEAAKQGFLRREVLQGQQILEGLGVQNKVARFAGGLALDILTDPLMHGTTGVGSFAKGALTGTGATLTQGSKEWASKLAATRAYKAAEAKALKDAQVYDVAELARRTGKTKDDAYRDISRAAYSKYYDEAEQMLPTGTPIQISNLARRKYGEEAAKKYGEHLKVKAGRGATFMGRTIKSGAEMQDAGAKFGKTVREAADRVPIVGAASRTIGDVARKWFSTKSIDGLGGQSADIYRNIENRARGSRALGDIQTREMGEDIATLQDGLTLRDGRKVSEIIEEAIANNKARLTKEDLDMVITTTPAKKFAARRIASKQSQKREGYIKDPENMTLGELINLYSRQARSIAIKESRAGLLKGGALNLYRPTDISGALKRGEPVEDYTARVRKVDKGFSIRGGKTRNLSVSNWYAMRRNDYYKGMTAKEINKRLGEEFLEEDPLRALISRRLTSNKMLAEKDFVDEILDVFGIRLHNAEPEDFARLQAQGYVIVLPKLKYNLLATGGDKAVKEIADTLDDAAAHAIVKGQSSLNVLEQISSDKATQLFVQLGKNARIYAVPIGVMKKVNESASQQLNEGLQILVNIANKFYSMWKPAVTGMRLQYHERNVGSSSFNNFLALGKDMFAKDTQRIAAAVAATGRGASVKTEKFIKDAERASINIRGKTYTAKEIHDLMVQNNALNTFFMTDAHAMNEAVMKDVMTRQEGGIIGQLKKANPLTAVPRGLKAWSGLGRALGNTIEEYVRATAFIGFMKRGYTPEDAAEMVAKYHFDYQDLTVFEKAIKGSLIPFYTWMRKNLPLQLESILNDPRPYLTLYRASRSGAEIEGMDYEELPDYLKKNMAVPLGRDENGRVKVWDFGLPVGELHTSWEDIRSGLNPVTKMLYETTSGRSLLTGAPVRSYEGQEAVGLINLMGGKDKVHPMVQKALLSKPGIAATAAGKYVLGNSGVFRDMANYGILEPKDTQVVQQGRHVSSIENPVLRFFGSQFDPNFVKHFSPEIAARGRDYDYERQLSNLIQRLKAMGIPIRTMNEIK